MAQEAKILGIIRGHPNVSVLKDLFEDVEVSSMCMLYAVQCANVFTFLVEYGR